MSIIKEITSKENYTVEDLLDQSEALIMVITSNPKETKYIIDFFSKDESMKKVIDYIGYPPVPRDKIPEEKIPEMQKILNYSNASLQIIEQSRVLMNTILNSTRNLSHLFNILKHTTSFTVFNRIVQVLVFFFMISPKGVVEYLRSSEPEFFEILVSHVGTALPEDILMVVRLLLRAEKKIPGTVAWMVEKQLIIKLIHLFSPDKSNTVHQAAAHILGELLGETKMGIEQSEEKAASLTPLMSQFVNEETIDTLFYYMRNSPSSMQHILYLLTGALESELEREDSIIILKFIDNIDIFLKYLKSDEPKKIIQSTCGQVASLGMVKLAIIQFVLVLATEEPEVSSVLVEANFYSVALELMVKYPTNNILHDIVLQLFLLLCTQEEEEVVEVFRKTKLLELIGNTWEKIYNSNKYWGLEQCKITGEQDELRLPYGLTLSKYIVEESGKKKEYLCSYFGHLAILANMIDDLEKDWTSLSKLTSDNKSWLSFVANGLGAFNFYKIKAVDATSVNRK